MSRDEPREDPRGPEMSRMGRDGEMGRGGGEEEERRGRGGGGGGAAPGPRRRGGSSRPRLSASR